MFTSRIVVVLDENGVVGAHAEFSEVAADGRVRLLGRRQADAADLESLLPNVATIAAQAADAAAKHAEAINTKDREIDRLAMENAELQSQLARPPAGAIDAQGFAILSAVQIRLALLKEGITAADIDEAIAAIPDPAERMAAAYIWEYSTTYGRSHPLVSQLGAALGLSETEIDAMWKGAV